MKVTKHVEHLIRQGGKPEELVKLGSPKHVITRVHTKLRLEKVSSEPGAGQVTVRRRSGAKSPVTPLAETSPIQPRMDSLESKLQQPQGHLGALEALPQQVENIESRLSGAPGLGLKHRFKCSCGASGPVAIRIQCQMQQGNALDLVARGRVTSLPA